MVVQPGFLPQRCHFLHFSLFSQVVQDLFCRFYLPGAISVQHALSSSTRKRENGGGYENNFTFSVSVFNLSLTRLVIYMRPGLVMDVLRISAQRFSTFPNSISCTNIPRNSKDGKVRVLVAGGWSGHNIRTAEVNNFPGSFEQLYWFLWTIFLFPLNNYVDSFEQFSCFLWTVFLIPLQNGKTVGILRLFLR